MGVTSKSQPTEDTQEKNAAWRLALIRFSGDVIRLIAAVIDYLGK